MSRPNEAVSSIRAFNRFGLGVNTQQKMDLTRDPIGQLKAELRAENAMIADGELSDTATNLVNFRNQQEENKTARMNKSAGNKQMKQEPDRKVQRKAFLSEAGSRFSKAYSAETGFLERLVWFWSNHFCVSTAKNGTLVAVAGSFEREAIRPHVLGKFSDMLRAAEQHPAMLLYLDNASSIGPNSRAGTRRQKGLNENLAREILELHTVGIKGGYTQEDVTSFARIITGWTIAGMRGSKGEPGTFIFNPNFHEPGTHSVLGKAYQHKGIEQGQAVLNDLAKHETTAQHIAFKFARHFVADDPPAELVKSLAGNFMNTGGDLKSLAITLIEDELAWSSPSTKIRSPQEFVLASSRALGLAPTNPAPLSRALENMGHALWRPPGPNGFSDTNAVWASAEGLKTRVDYAALMARNAQIQMNPSELLQACCGQSVSKDTTLAVTRAESPQQGVALVLMSPEFQRR